MEKTTTTDEKLEAILKQLTELNRRDRYRTAGSFVHTLLTLIPLLLFLWSAWYIYHNMDEFIRKITSEAAKQTLMIEGSADEGAMQKLLEKYLPKN